MISFGNLDVRVCFECRESLVKSLSGRKKRVMATLDFKEIATPTDPPMPTYSVRGTTDDKVWYASFLTKR